MYTQLCTSYKSSLCTHCSGESIFSPFLFPKCDYQLLTCFETDAFLILRLTLSAFSPRHHKADFHTSTAAFVQIIPFKTFS